MPPSRDLAHQRKQESVTGGRGRERLGLKVLPRQSFSEAGDGNGHADTEHGSPLDGKLGVDSLHRLVACLDDTVHRLDAVLLEIAGELRLQVADAEDQFVGLDVSGTETL